LGADYSANPYASSLRSILLQIDPDAGSRLPKRRMERPAGQKPSAAAHAVTQEKSAKPSGHDVLPAAEPAAKTEPEKKAGKKKGSAQDEPHAAPAADRLKKKPAHSARAEAKTDKAHHAESPQKKSTSEGLSKRKPR